jgi:nitrite reductase/ring-hydroxylating ferredoxin subunit
MDRAGDRVVTWRDVAASDEAARARPWLAVEVDGLDLVLAEVDDTWYAVEDRCTHAGCPFSQEATLEGSTIVCNCHGSEFDLATGEPRRGPAERPVRSFPVRVRAGRIEVGV